MLLIGVSVVLSCCAPRDREPDDPKGQGGGMPDPNAFHIATTQQEPDLPDERLDFQLQSFDNDAYQLKQ